MRKQQFWQLRVAGGIILGGMLALAGCGGGGTTETPVAAPAPAPITLTGIAAGGAAIVGGTVDAKCSTGTGSATTAADGTYSLTLTGIAPCLLQVADPTNAAKVYYSAVQAGTTTANITPLTSLIVANALGADPAIAYASFSGTTASNITTGGLSAAVTKVAAALTAVGVTIPSGTDPLTASFTAATESNAGSALDQQIDTLMSILANANVPLSTLATTIATNNASAGAATTAVSTLATNSGISSSTLGTSANGTTEATSCPYATSGTYLAVNLGGSDIQKLSINFGELTGSNVTKGVDFTITSGVDPNNPCAYSFTTAETPSQTFNVRGTQSGLAAYSAAAIPTAPSALLSDADLGIVVPAPHTPYAVADFKGSWDVISFSRPTSATSWGTGVTQIVNDGLGTSTYYTCANDGTSCSTTASSTATITGPDDTGVFTSTGSDGSVNRIVLYRSSNGDMVAIGVLSSSATMSREYFVASQRVSALTVRKVDSTYSSVAWIVTNSTAGLVQTASEQSYTVTNVTSDPVTFTRYKGTDTLNTDTVQIDVPRAGMITRDQVDVIPGVSDKPAAAFVAVGGLGWVVLATTTSSAPGATGSVYFGISLSPPHQ